jgi:hypothetical protein
MELYGENRAQMSFCHSRRFRNNFLSFALVEPCGRDLYVVGQRSFDVCDLFVIAYISLNKIFFDDL